MKKIFLYILIWNVSLLNAQTNPKTFDLSKYYVFKFNTRGINDFKTADYVARSIEKSELTLFSAFKYNEEIGYAIVTDTYYAHEIEKYINNMMVNIHLEEPEILELTEDLFLDMYFTKSDVIQNKTTQLPPFISMGPYTQLANDLYALAKKIWVNKYPEAYKAMFHSAPLTPEQIEEQNQKLNRKN